MTMRFDAHRKEVMRTTRSRLARRAVCLALLLCALDAPARLLPTAPVSAWPVLPAVQRRSARQVVVLELVSYGAACGCVPSLMRVAIHDSQGIEAPRYVTPGGTPALFTKAAALEGPDRTLRILVYGFVDSAGHAAPDGNYLYSPDSGATWVAVAALAGLQSYGFSGFADFGGPVAGGSSSPIRLGTPSVPFVLTTQSGFWAVRADGSGFLLSPAWGGALLGSDLGGAKFLVSARLFSPPPPTNVSATFKVAVLDLSGNLQQLFELAPDFSPWIEGWIAPDGSAYLNVDWSQGGNNFYSTPHAQPLPSTHSVTLCRQGTVEEIVSSDFQFAVLAAPSADFSQAWILTSDSSATALSSFTPSGGLVESWRDPSRPRITAIFAGDSGERLLLQKSHSRPSARGSLQLDWALWSQGQPAPVAYDAVVVETTGGATLVHLDVDAAADGAPILIDPGSPQNIARPSGGPIPPTAPNDFPTQTLVRASLRQQLVIPAVARAAGKRGSNWRTDLILRNPGTSDLHVTARLLANPLTTSQPADASLTLSPGTLTVVPDVLDGLFHLEQASGALLLIPDATGTIQATSRTYTASGNGTYGMAVDAEDVVAGVGPGLEQTFAAGLLGAGFRSNFVASDLSGRDSQLQLFPQTGGTIGGPLSISTPPMGQSQLDDLAVLTASSAASSSAFRAASSSGSVMTGLIAIDDATNDPTWFGPDAPAGSLIIPAIVHVRGANGADYRTDLFLFNPDPVPHVLGLRATPWDQPESVKYVPMTLAPGESRRVPDALFTLFGWSGVAQLFIESGFPNGGVLVTSRTYAAREDGSTYGMALPPLRASQTVTPGETLEILGPTGAPSLRTNLALVQLSRYLVGPPNVLVQILDEKGDVLDSFVQAVPAGNGLQLNDLFRARGLGDGPKAALIRLSPSSGILASYATTIDNATNDPVYFAGNLAP
jgi:hypothetical protein